MTFSAMTPLAEKTMTSPSPAMSKAVMSSQ